MTDYLTMAEVLAGVALGHRTARRSMAAGIRTCASCGCSIKAPPYRVLYAFDPNRNAILLVGGDKTGNNRWYEIFVPVADRLYDQHLKELEKR
jgi:hypothetical protein